MEKSNKSEIGLIANEFFLGLHTEAATFEIKKLFVSYDRPPTKLHKIDSIVVLGTSKTIDRAGYDIRVGTAVSCAEKFPTSEVIFTGKQVYGDRALPHESGENYIESSVMANDAVLLGLSEDRIKLETKSLNARDNIVFAEEMLSPKTEGVIYVTSGYLGKRVDLYLKKMIDQKEIAKRNHFVVDADVRREENGFDPLIDEETKKRMEWRVDYEFSRIIKYRKSGDL